MKNKFVVNFICFLTIYLINHSATAATFNLPSPYDLVGQVEYRSSGYNDNVVTVAQRYDLGVDQIADANPHVDPHREFSSGVVLQLPTAFILPPVARRGIVINLAEMRLYYYPEGSGIVKTYPVGIGKIGKTIPVTHTYVTNKVVNPVWTPTPDIREYNREQGIHLPENIPPGPDNPLGPYAIYLGISSYRIHSTIFPESIGRRASFGCIRMNEDDIKDFFDLVRPNTSVNIIDMPTKIGWNGNKLYLEVHPPLEEHRTSSSTYDGVAYLVKQAASRRPTIVNWQLVEEIADTHDGVPHQVGMAVR